METHACVSYSRCFVVVSQLLFIAQCMLNAYRQCTKLYGRVRVIYTNVYVPSICQRSKWHRLFHLETIYLFHLVFVNTCDEKGTWDIARYVVKPNENVSVFCVNQRPMHRKWKLQFWAERFKKSIILNREEKTAGLKEEPISIGLVPQHCHPFNWSSPLKLRH